MPSDTQQAIHTENLHRAQNLQPRLTKAEKRQIRTEVAKAAGREPMQGNRISPWEIAGYELADIRRRQAELEADMDREFQKL